MTDLGALDGHLFEVTVLDEAPPLCSMTVLREGRLCCVRDAGAPTDFLEWVAPVRSHRGTPGRWRRSFEEWKSRPGC